MDRSKSTGERTLSDKKKGEGGPNHQKDEEKYELGWWIPTKQYLVWWDNTSISHFNLNLATPNDLYLYK